MYRQHKKNADKGQDKAGMMGMMHTMKPPHDDAIPISNSFRVNLKIKDFKLKMPKGVEDVDLVISIYEVPSDAEGVPKALCENFIVTGWSANPQQNIGRENLRVVYGDIYKVSVMEQ